MKLRQWTTMPRKFRSVRLCALLVSLALSFGSQAASTQVNMTLAQQPGVVVNPDIFGQFSEFIGTGIYGGIWVGPQSTIPNIDGFCTDVVHALRDLGVPVVCWPGGCYADCYDWRDGVGAQ